MKRCMLLVVVVLCAACSSGGDGGGGSVTIKPSLVYDCVDGTRIVLVGDDAWVHEQADGTDIAKGTDADFWPALDACKP